MREKTKKTYSMSKSVTITKKRRQND